MSDDDNEWPALDPASIVSGSDPSGREFWYADFDHADLTGVNFSGATFYQYSFRQGTAAKADSATEEWDIVDL